MTSSGLTQAAARSGDDDYLICDIIGHIACLVGLKSDGNPSPINPPGNAETATLYPCYAAYRAKAARFAICLSCLVNRIELGQREEI
jgi:hypothetical protein